MAEQQRFVEPDPTKVLGESVDHLNRKIQTFGISLTLITILQLLTGFLAVISDYYLSGIFVEQLVQFFLTISLIGFFILLYYTVSLFLFVYRYVRYETQLEPNKADESILRVENSNFQTIHSVKKSNAKSISFSFLGLFLISFWPSLVEYFVNHLQAIRAIQRIIAGSGFSNLSDTIIVFASVITQSNVRLAVDSFNQSQFITFIKIVPPLIGGYIVFRHIIYIVEKMIIKGEEHRDIGLEIKGLFKYLQVGLSQTPTENIKAKFLPLVLYCILATSAVAWHLTLFAELALSVG